MPDSTSAKFDDDDVNDDELLAACDDTIGTIPAVEHVKTPDPIVPIVEIASFGFPFQPYSIQEDFMRALYGTIYQRKHGIFESPTGTVIAILLTTVYEYFAYCRVKV